MKKFITLYFRSRSNLVTSRGKFSLLNKLIFSMLLLHFHTLSFATDSHHSNSLNHLYTEDKLNITVTPQQPVFTLQLKSNPTTGFSWFLREYDHYLLTPVNHSFQASQKNLLGTPGFELWTFRVKPNGLLVPQQTVIRMVYARPWQGSDNSTQLVFRVSTMSNIDTNKHEAL